MTSRSTALVAALICLCAAAPAQAARLYAVTQNPTPQVIGFDSAAPGTVLSSVQITGFATQSEVVKGIDLRPATGELLLVTRQRVYRLDPTTGVLTQPLAISPILPDGVAFGVDVDPVENALRVIGDDNSNRTISLITGAVTSHPSIDPPTLALDAIAYSGAGGLFAFGSGTDGIFTPVADEDTGQFAPGTEIDVDAGTGTEENSAMDILGSTAFITARASGSQRLFAEDTVTLGTATEIGPIAGDPDVRGLAVVDNLLRHATASVAASEGDVATLVVAREAPRGSTTLSWTAQAGTAASGSDFGASSGSVTFGEGETHETIAIPLPEDTADEAEEAFTVSLTGATAGAAIVGTRAATVRVLDDDPPTTTPTPAREQVLVPFEVVIPAPVRALLAGNCANAQVGTAGDDALIGTVAGDKIGGGAGADALVGRAGNDCLEGGPGNDWLNAAEGNDRLEGGSGEDVLLGGRGNDAMVGGNGDDRIAGGDGADTISGGNGSNHLLGGTGNDRISARNGRRDVIDCGGGRDRVTIDIRRDRTRACEVVPGT